MLADRMSVKTMAYKYFTGADGFPVDMEVAYCERILIHFHCRPTACQLYHAYVWN